MSRTANVFARVEPEIKEQSENILNELGMPMSNAISIFLRQVIMQKGIPFEVKLPNSKPLQYGALSKTHFNEEIAKGLKDIENGNVYSADSVESEMKKEFGL